jgi:thioredoxin reductase (NADPH)
MEEALFLTRFASRVTIVNRSEEFRASKIMLDRATAHPLINFVTSTTVEEILGVEEKEVKGLRLKHKITGEETILPVSGMFLGIGHEPNARAFVGLMDMDEDGYITTTKSWLRYA